MPANLSPEYKDAQEKFRRARDPQEKLECLREMGEPVPEEPEEGECPRQGKRSEARQTEGKDAPERPCG